MNHKLKGIRAIFFDAGGTLINLDSSRICELVNRELGIKTSAENFSRAQSLAMQKVAEMVEAGAGSTESLKREFYSTLLPEIGVSGDSVEDATVCILKLAQAEMLWYKTDEATAAVLARLKERGLILGVVSNSDGRIESAFKRAALADYFDFFIDSFLVGVEKPDPAIFKLATDCAAVLPEEAAYVGDLYSVDVVGARKAGLLPILYDPYDLNREADCLRIREIGDLLELTEGPRD